MKIFKIALAICAILITLTVFAHEAKPIKKAPVIKENNVKKRTPHVGDVVYPQAYTGGYCGWQDCDGLPWPYPNPYCRSSDWVGRAAIITAVYTYCVVLKPQSPIVPGNYSIYWDINYI